MLEEQQKRGDVWENFMIDKYLAGQSTATRTPILENMRYRVVLQPPPQLNDQQLPLPPHLK